MVLKGIPWESLRPRLILCEFEDKKTLPLGYSYHDLAKYLLERGYHLIVSEWKPIKRYGEKHDWRGFYPYPHKLQTPKAWGNLIAARDKADYESLSQFIKVIMRPLFHLFRNIVYSSIVPLPSFLPIRSKASSACSRSSWL